MSSFRAIIAGLRLLFRREKANQELNEELGTFLEMATEEKVKDGMSRKDAVREVRLERGSLELAREVVGASGWESIMQTSWQDLRFAVRTLWKNRAFTTVAVLTLALGIGATTAMFSVVDGVLLRPLPYSQPDQLVEVGLDLPGINQFNWPLSPQEYFTSREQNCSFQDIGLYYTGFGAALYSVNVSGRGQPEHVPTLGVTDAVLPILGVTPLLGRSFTREDDEPGSADTAIITYGYWRSKFGGDPSVIGKAIDLDGKPSTIIGVLPQRFQFLDMTNLNILPLRPRTQRGFNYFAVGRLKQGVTLAEARADVARMLFMQVTFSPRRPTSSRTRGWLRICSR